MNDHENIDIDEWLDMAEGFSSNEIANRIVETEEAIHDLRAQQLRLVRRLNALQSLVQPRTPVPGQMRIRGHLVKERSKVLPAPIQSETKRIGTSAAVLALLRETPDKEWAILDILHGLADRDQLPASKDPRRALDATIHRLTNVTHQIERVAKGRYRLTPSGMAEQHLRFTPSSEGGESG